MHIFCECCSILRAADEGQLKILSHIRRRFKNYEGKYGSLSLLTPQTIRLSSYLQSVTLTHSKQRSPIITDLKKESVCSGKLLVVFLC